MSKKLFWKIAQKDINDYIDKKKKLEDTFFDFEAKQSADKKKAEAAYMQSMGLLHEDLRDKAGVPDEIENINLRGSKFIEADPPPPQPQG